jgi:secondary thiamine-phosphate synthase enzyme
MGMEIVVATTRRVEAIDLTDLLFERDLPDGVLLASLPHTTAALVISEADAELLSDFERVASTWALSLEPFQHHKNDNPNAAAHIFSAFAGSQVLFYVEDGKPQLGKFQRLVLLELDGPKERQVHVRSVSAGGAVGS